MKVTLVRDAEGWYLVNYDTRGRITRSFKTTTEALEEALMLNYTIDSLFILAGDRPIAVTRP